ncbi:putative Peptidase M23B (Modular protein) [Magnetospirillum sp. LM-5]|uniref:murein hydrolase activator EnvC family protein n=1 Tax=Magnetospirillum sp. LM-5 TaxID=2681466 RepID=UPI001380B45B|nr:peptidoglycan DD-metalloendopeptidase family protein [Magnetospirillum sp. LM-5]CAA7621131.1 putative Peptidase M23B (Modular protein) [Magnetospirillum sp. LM-5]
MAARLALAILILLAGGASPVLAQSSPDPIAADRRLRELEDQLRKSRTEHDEIKKKAREISEELGRIRSDMVAAARAAQESEELLSELESQLEELKVTEIDRAGALQRRSGQMTGVLTALQRLAWRPTDALIAQPQSPADTVRSAILLRAAVPQIERSVQDLKGEIDMLGRLRADIHDQKARIGNTAIRLDGEHKRLKGLWERKSAIQFVALAETEASEARMRKLAGEAEDLRELLIRLEEERQRRLAEAAAKAAAEKAAREAEIAAQKAAREAEIAAQKAAREAEAAARRAEKERQEREMAAARAAREAEIRAQAEARAAELAAHKAVAAAEAAAREAAAARPQTMPSFGAAQGKMPFPARGTVVGRFGQPNEVGVISKGLTIGTRQGAQVIAPHDGQVAFSGPFRGYGLLLIIEHGEGYHTLLAGMARIDATVGQRLAAGEPVGVMGQDEARPTLYVELRRQGQPVNPLPWLTAQKNKGSG